MGEDNKSVEEHNEESKKLAEQGEDGEEKKMENDTGEEKAEQKDENDVVGVVKAVDSENTPPNETDENQLDEGKEGKYQRKFQNVRMMTKKRKRIRSSRR